MAATLSPTEITRLNLKLDTSPGLPKLPYIPSNIFSDPLTPRQQEANLLHVALWIYERDTGNFNMGGWHEAWAKTCNSRQFLEWQVKPSGEEGYHSCGTAHCIAGFAQIMCGPQAFDTDSHDAGLKLLGHQAELHFYDTDEDALAFLKLVIASNS